MSKSISITSPSEVVSLKLESAGNGDKIGGKLDLSIFNSAKSIRVSNLDITELGEISGLSFLETIDASNNKITNISNNFNVPASITNFNLNKNNLTETDIERILSAFVNTYGNVSAISPKPIIDISQFGNAVPNTAGLVHKDTLIANGWDVKYNPGDYVLSSDALSVTEGGPNLVINISRTVSDIADDTLVGYTVTGIDANDVAQSLSGSFTITDNVGSATFSIANDFGTDNYLEGESFVMTLNSPHNATSISIPIIDTTPAPYQFISFASREEGSVTFNITLSTTTGTTVPDNTQVGYTISGIQDADIAENLSGNFTLTNNTGTIPITVLSDADTEENETLTITLNAPYGAVSKDIRIFDQ